jgi:hypothetical protein
MDRNFDLQTTLLNDWSFYGLINDFLKLQNGKIMLNKQETNFNINQNEFLHSNLYLQFDQANASVI